MKKLCLIFVLAGLFRSALAQENPAPPVPVQSVVHSRVLNEDRPILVRTPPGYADGKLSYPVLYLLDGDTRINAVGSTADFLADGGEIPQLIVVAVINPNSNRKRDLALGNGSEELLRFLGSELMPEIQQRYRTQPFRMLAGDSTGALLVMRALTSKPEGFGAYIALSPHWTEANPSPFSQIEGFLKLRKEPLNAFFFLAGSKAGENQRLDDLLSHAALPKQFQWASSLAQEADEPSANLCGYAAALCRVFADYPMPHDAKGLPVGGLAGLEEHYRKLTERLGYTLPAPEKQINDLAYKYMQASPPDMASAVAALKRNVELYPDSPNAYDSLCEAYFRAGQGELAEINGLKAVSLAKAQHDPRVERFEYTLTNYRLRLATLQAWFGQDAEFANTLKRGMEHARANPFPDVVERAVKAAFLRPGTDKATLQECLELARHNVVAGKDSRYYGWFQLSLGMGEYRNGHYPQCEAAMIAAVQAQHTHYDIAGISIFYRAMSLFQQGKEAEARALSQEGIAIMYPPEADPKNPLRFGEPHDDLIMRMAANEAFALLKMPGPSEAELQHQRESLESAQTLARQVVDEIAAGKTLDATNHFAAASELVPRDTELALIVGAMQAWLGQDQAYALTVRRATDFARNTSFATTAERAAKLGLLRPTTDKAQLEASVALAHRGMELGRNDAFGVYWFEMALGMAEYRSGNYESAEQLLRAAAQHAGNDKDISISTVPWTSGFYRAMALYRSGKEAEARSLFLETEAKMKPLPSDASNPMGGTIMSQNIIAWLAHNEAKALLKVQVSP